MTTHQTSTQVRERTICSQPLSLSLSVSLSVSLCVSLSLCLSVSVTLSRCLFSSLCLTLSNSHSLTLTLSLSLFLTNPNTLTKLFRSICAAISVFAPSPNQAIYGRPQNKTSWGGNMVHYQGQWHLLVTEMRSGGLINWTTDSQVVHAVADTIEGPYTREAVALPVPAHNPMVINTTDATGQPLFVLFHIFSGGSALPGAVVHYSASPTGPWQAAELDVPSCNNPAPMLHANGTWFLACNEGTWELYRSQGNFTGPYTKVAALPKNPPLTGVWEDPFVWIDARGNWHMIGHAYNEVLMENCNKSLASGHYFSPDGLVWHAATAEPYHTAVTFTDGTTHTFASLERPKIIVNGQGQEAYIVFGASPDEHCNNTCTRCKTTPGYDHTYTLIRPLVI
ncbi:uncharacterized protein MONBRDRAFT_25698 [Monosiga brevicollis MX1]|uniref:Uncharacterized protein n=1 Tax=Monosiga brevicollis TaxID=81824 RepID=A9V058_MONBE|nr:uncharacterized protein MONBRDRAFT_25698 [Monosiga brevicollis MX1]EDQ89099.1 predicted protein [Monosiga brevicollis MX1]|eukprot:XP_001746204.1 hypothetical protein [Monosiga brevicollis MX1]